MYDKISSEAREYFEILKKGIYKLQPEILKPDFYLFY